MPPGSSIASVSPRHHGAIAHHDRAPPLQPNPAGRSLLHPHTLRQDRTSPIVHVDRAGDL
eukprot:2409526-Rhodomonas_salina.2